MSPRTLVLLAVLTLSAGYADAVAFFAFTTFTANMTGNTVLFGADIARMFLPNVPWSKTGFGFPVLSIACFVAGGVAAAIVLRRDDARHVRRIAVLGAATVLVVAAAFLYHHGAPGNDRACVALLSAVMGMQSLVAVRAGVGGVSTVYVTGTVVTAIIDLAGGRRTEPHVRIEGSANVATWFLYLVGATGGVVALRTLANAALWPVAAAIAFLLPFAA